MVKKDSGFSIEYANNLVPLLKKIQKEENKKFDFIHDYVSFMKQEYEQAFEVFISGKRISKLDALFKEINFAIDLMDSANKFFVQAHGDHEKPKISARVSTINTMLHQAKKIIGLLLVQNNKELNKTEFKTRLDLISSLFIFCKGYTSKEILDLSKETRREYNRLMGQS